MTYSTGHLTISIPLTSADHQIADRFSREQPTLEKSEQVYWNTLAVLVVHYYLEMLEISTDLKSSYSWNPVGRLCANVADVKLPGIGHLECRSVKIGEPFCVIPPDVWHDRVGYAIVQFDPDLSQGTILGFVPTVSQMTIDLDSLQSLDALLIRLYNFESSEVVIPPLSAQNNIVKNWQLPGERLALDRSHAEEKLTRLGQWFDDLFDAGWQAIDRVLSPSATCLDFRFRSTESSEDYPTVKRGKLIDLGIQLSGYSIVLLIELKRVEHERVDVRLQVRPSGGRIYLPPHLQLIVKDRASGSRMQTKSRQSDNYIQLRLVGDAGDQFSAILSLNHVSVTEEFVI
jgi:Protein of unknown function (DUF1822)